MVVKAGYIGNFISEELPIAFNNAYSEKTIPIKILKENSIQNIRFNVMPDRYVEEDVKIKEYRVWDNAIETIFDRDYKTDMLNSPSHLTFLSSLTNLQKMVYVFMHHYLSLDYNKDANELIKVWPGKLNIDMPKMIMKKTNISHLMVIKSIYQIKKNRYKVKASTIVDNAITITGEALIIVL